MATLAEVEGVLTLRLGGYLSEAGMVVASGSNPNLVDPISWALRMLALAPAALGTVTDADVALATSDKLDALLDLAELRTLESLRTNLIGINATVGPVSEERASIAERLAKWLPMRRAQVAAMHDHLLALPLTPEAEKSIRLRAI